MATGEHTNRLAEDMSWKARLEGERADLGLLTQWFPDTVDPSVAIGADGFYYLSAQAFGTLSDASARHAEAEKTLKKLNGVGRSRDPAFRPVTMGVLFDDETGNQSLALDTLRMPIRLFPPTIVVGDDSPPLPEERVEFRQLELSTTDQNVADALRFLGSDELDNFAIGKVYEIIRDDVGGTEAVVSAFDWMTKRDVSRFTGSLNRPEVSGDAARHARYKGDPPKRWMTPDEVQAFIARLYNAWIGRKLGND